MADKKKKMVKVAKGVKISRKKEKELDKKAGSSNTGEYKNVKPSDFAGAAGGASKYSYPINTKKRAKAALAYAHNAPNPEGIKNKVYKKYPELNSKKGKKNAKEADTNQNEKSRKKSSASSKTRSKRGQKSR